MPPARFTYPSTSAGYWRGAGVAGPGAANWSEMGTATQGIGMQSQGTINVAGQAWHPTIIYLLLLILAEMFVFGFIGRILK
jgi:hypothetical protein